MDRSYKNKDTLEYLYLDQNLTRAEIAKRFDGASGGSTIQYWLNKYDISKDKERYATGPPVSEKRLWELYFEKEKSQSDIAYKFDVTQSAVKKWMQHYEIETRGPGGVDGPEKFDKAELKRLHEDKGLNSRETADELGVSINTVRRWRDRMGLKSKPTGGKKKHKVDNSRLIELYESGLTESDIAQKLSVDVCQSTIGRWLRELDVEMKNQAGWGQQVETDRGETVKSSLELRVANWLFENNIDYTYEPEIDNTVYVPDFKVQDNLIEVWGITNSNEYDQRREQKLEVYDELGFNVISVFNIYHEGIPPTSYLQRSPILS